MSKVLISNSQNEFEADFLSALFGCMVEGRIRYAVLRNFKNLPYSVGARDIDIVVYPDDLQGACNLVLKIARQMDLRYANSFSDERLVQYSLVRRDSEGGLQQIKIDFFTCSELYGIQVLSAEEMLTDLRYHHGVAVVSDRVLLLDKWLFHLLVGRPLHTKYDKNFAAIAQKESAAVNETLSRFLPPRRAASLLEVIAAGKGSTLVMQTIERYLALARLWAAQGLKALWSSLRFTGFRFRDWLRPHGVFLSVSGPDGSGKTTVIEMVVTQLEAIFGQNAVYYSHFRPKMLPRIAELAKKTRAVKTVDENYEQPHRAKPSGLVGSTARLVYYCLDYMIGYYRIVLPVLKRRQVMLFDRYYFDMIADSFRSRISLPMPLLQVMARFLPLPKYAFFIHVDPEEIYRRKQELTLERIVQLNARYVDLAERGWLIQIENNNTPEEAASAIVDYIIADRHARAIRSLD